MNPLTLLRAFDAAVMPVRCVFCGTRTHAHEGYVCGDCCDDLPWRHSASTPVHSPLDHEMAPLAYKFPVDAAIKSLKFRRRLYYGPALAQLACSVLDDLPGGIDAVLPVPLHWRRKLLRGFNQAREIARPVARRLGVPIIRNVVRCRATAPQAGLSASRRETNLRGAFALRRRLVHRHVLIIDDVITTGSTLRQVAGVLRQHGAEMVAGLAVARA
jgi:ComF family protein